MRWKIKSTTRTDRHGRPQYWSEDVGWTWKDMADTYTEAQRQALTLQKDAEWEAQEP